MTRRETTRSTRARRSRRATVASVVASAMVSVVVVLSMCATASFARASRVTPTTIDEFSERVLMVDVPAIVNFHSPTCPHCRALAPEWDMVREEFSERNVVVVADVDCSTSRDLCEWQKVRAYPTIKFYDDVNGESGEEYRRPATYDAISAFIEHFLER